jgi:hypothetical protein
LLGAADGQFRCHGAPDASSKLSVTSRLNIYLHLDTYLMKPAMAGVTPQKAVDRARHAGP